MEKVTKFRELRQVRIFDSIVNHLDYMSFLKTPVTDLLEDTALYTREMKDAAISVCKVLDIIPECTIPKATGEGSGMMYWQYFADNIVKAYVNYVGENLFKLDGDDITVQN